MASVTLTTLRARVRELADLGASTFVTDAATSLDAFINTGIQKLHDAVLDAMGDDFLGESSSSFSVTVAAGAGTVALPTDFHRLTGLNLTVNGVLLDLARLTRKERNAMRAQSGIGPFSVPRYRLSGANIIINGQNGTYSGSIDYSPAPTLLASGSDAINYPNGWEHYAVLYAAILVASKEETDPSTLLALFQMEEARIDAAASRRDSANPPQMADVERGFTNSDSPWEL